MGNEVSKSAPKRGNGRPEKAPRPSPRASPRPPLLPASSPDTPRSRGTIQRRVSYVKGNRPPPLMTKQDSITSETLGVSSATAYYNKIAQKNPSYFDNWLLEFQEENLKRMKEELRGKDFDLFILNNLLLCYQFWDNFERTKERGNAWKFRREKSMNDRLLHLEVEGSKVLSEHCAFALHGLPHYLNKLYVYSREKGDIPEALDISSLGGEEIKNTLLPNALLPIDFYICSENLEIYEESRWKELLEEESAYEAPGNEKPVMRFCAEEPNSKNKVLKGYVRLRSADLPELIYNPGKWLLNYEYTDIGPPNNAIDDGIYMELDQDKDQDREYAYPVFTPPENGREEAVKMTIPDPPEIYCPETEGGSGMAFLDDIRSKMEGNSFGGSGLSIALSKSGSITSLVSISLEPMLLRTELESKPMTLSDKILSKHSPHLLKGKKNKGKEAKEDLKDQSMQKSKSMQNLYQDSSSGYSSSLTDLTNNLYIGNPGGNLTIPMDKYGLLYKTTSIPANMVELTTGSGVFLSVPVSDEEGGDASQEEFDSSVDSIQLDTHGKPIRKKKKSNPGSTQWEKKLKTYLNASEISSDFFTNFHRIGKMIDLPSSSLANAVVFGASIRLPLYEIHQRNEYSNLNTFTFCLRCGFWPRKALAEWNHALAKKGAGKVSELIWPNASDLKDIEGFGCTLIPLSFRPLAFGETNQAIDFQVNFLQAESTLLNSWKAVHWRAYIFSALLFRAFLAPLGHLGVGLEHFRNVLFFMCQAEFAGWNDEDPGLHLRAILNKMYTCLGQRRMPSFFIRSRNMIKFISREKLALIQAHLNKIRDNLIMSTLWALKGLKCLRIQDQGVEESFYPAPDLDNLADILTVDENLLPGIMYPHLRAKASSKAFIPKYPMNNGGAGVNFNKNTGGRKMSEDLSRSPRIDQGDPFGRNDLGPLSMDVRMGGGGQVKDETRELYLRKHLKHQQKQQQRKVEVATKKRNSGHDIAMEEMPNVTEVKAKKLQKQRDAINKFLERKVTSQRDFSNLRLVIMIEFFIEQFLLMAAKAKEYKDFSLVMMYALHVENLCDIMAALPEDKTPKCDAQIRKYLATVKGLKQSLGKNKHQYIHARISHLVPGSSKNS